MKISINIFTYIFYLLLIFCGYINYLAIYFLIMIIHELGHLFFIFLFNYKVLKVKVYPCNSIIETNISININSLKLFFISIGGILFQIILLILIPSTGSYNYDIFYRLNIFLIIFNLLPIYPLDGYKINLSIIEYFYKYRIIIYYSYILSILFLFLFLFRTKNIYMFIFLYILNIKYISNYKYYFHKFKLERYLYKKEYKKKKYINNENDLYKMRKNYIYVDNQYLEENEYFQNIYSNH